MSFAYTVHWLDNKGDRHHKDFLTSWEKCLKFHRRKSSELRRKGNLDGAHIKPIHECNWHPHFNDVRPCIGHPLHGIADWLPKDMNYGEQIKWFNEQKAIESK